MRGRVQLRRALYLGPDGGGVDTHLRSGVREAVSRQLEGIEKLLPEDIADAVAYVVTRDRRVAVNEMLVRAGAQTW
jgi:NADP-dependent 3-hydroxy acid dehydrogenase YdfG